jgi:hypothetical protein
MKSNDKKEDEKKKRESIYLYEKEKRDLLECKTLMEGLLGTDISMNQYIVMAIKEKNKRVKKMAEAEED